MRTIKFRGKCRETKEWVYGYYVYEGMGNHLIVSYNEERNKVLSWEVIPETVNEYVGCDDKYQVEIYENDYLLDEFLSTPEEKIYSRVIFNDGGFSTVSKGIYFEIREENETSAVVGNVVDNPELGECYKK